MIQLMLIICAAASLILGVLVLLSASRRPMNILAAGINACLALWSISILVFMDTTSGDTALISAKLYYIAAAIFAALLALLSISFPDDSDIPKRKLRPVIVACSVMVASIGLWPKFVTGNVIISGNGNYINVEVVSYLLFSLYFIVLFIYGMLTITRKYFNSSEHLKAQAGAYMAGVLCMSIPGFTTNLILPFFHNYSYIWVGPATSVFFLGILSYSIVRHGMFDIRLAVVRSVAYIFSIVTLGLMYFVAAFTISELFLDRSIDMYSSILYIAISLLLVLLFQPIRGFFDSVTSRFFYRDNYIEKEFISRITRVLASTSDLRKLLERAIREISDTLKAEQVFFFIYQQKHHVTAGTLKHSHIPIADAHSLDNLVDLSKTITITDTLGKDSDLRRILISHRVALVLPLKRNGVLIGYLMLGERKANSYTERDLNVLETVSDELVIAIQNALSVQEIKDLNENLQQKISTATEELRRSNSELQRLDEAKDEFVSMASHQLRTPLTSVKGYISMVLDGDAGDINKNQKALLEEAFTSSERMVHLINDFLNVSRLQTGRFILDRRLINLSKIVREEVESLETTADSRNLKLKYKTSKVVPKLYIDEGKIRQVVMNFIDNALYYSTPDTTIAVELTVGGDDITVTVKNTGIGVPVSEQSKLFNKFFRASNARKHRPDGTGVGLYLAKRVVTDHGGRIIFNSTEGKGSTFGFSLPIKRLSLVPADDSE